ncbi:MAG TPA: SDR family oxidoreductase [Flavobacteriales bacterium]|nr:SDR family oxidoreductase [Flavobacteriales bacterium]
MLNTIFKEGLFEGKKALVTGGGTGIGLRIARELATLGAEVVIASRKMENLEKGLNIITKEGGKAIAIECNIRNEDSIAACVTEAIEKIGGIDFLINNAGGQFPSPAENINTKGWNAVIETNLSGTFHMSRHVYNAIMKKNGGAIVNIIADMWNGFPMMSHTGAARAGVDNLTKTLAVEWGRNGVRVNSVAPGLIHSSGLDSYAPEFKQYILSAGKNNQANRMGTEEEVAAAVVYLLSPAAAYITGETLKVDAGESLYSPLFPPSEHEKIPPFKDSEN